MVQFLTGASRQVLCASLKYISLSVRFALPGVMSCSCASVSADNLWTMFVRLCCCHCVEQSASFTDL